MIVLNHFWNLFDTANRLCCKSKKLFPNKKGFHLETLLPFLVLCMQKYAYSATTSNSISTTTSLCSLILAV